MSDFRKMRLTPDGRELLALAHQGTPLEFSAIVLGNGVWTEAQQADASVSALVSQKVSVTITKITQTGDSARLEALLTNAALVAGFSITEIGIIAAHPTRGNVLYMVDYCAPEKSSYIQSKDGVPIEVPLAVDVLVASSQDVTLTIDDRFFGATRQDIADHNNRKDAHDALVDTLRAHTPLVVLVGSADIDEGDTVQLLIQDMTTYEWVSEIKTRITDGNGADVTESWSVAANVNTGLVELTAPEVSADKTFYASLQVWEHGLIRSIWTQAIAINVGDVPINRPTITAPAAGATGVGETPTITTSAFSADGAQTHADTQMQIATDAGFADIVRDTASLGAVTVYDVPPGILTTGQVYYVRARHKGSDGNWSPWSPVSSFFTAASFIYVDRPVNTSPLNGAGDIGETPTLFASAFSTNGTGNHAHTRFQIDVSGGDFSAPVHDSGELGAVTEYSVPAGVLAVATGYKFRAQYTDDSGTPVVSDWSAPTAFTTADNFLTNWVGWDEAAESTLAHPDTFVCLMENPNAGGNEMGQGGRTELYGDAIATQVGGLPGMDSGYRSNASISQKLSLVGSLISRLVGNNNKTWSIVIKVKNVSKANQSAMRWCNDVYAGGAIGFDTLRNDIWLKNWAEYPASTFPSSGTVYLCWWSDGASVHCGWTTAKPNSVADFPSTQKKTSSLSPDAFVGTSGTSYYGGSESNIFGSAPMGVQYVVISAENIFGV